MKIKLGADELILWLRKNELANDIPNDEMNGLGMKIGDIIKKVGGERLMDNHPVYWPIPEEGHAKIDKFKLPKTAAQYEIEIDRLPKIYSELLGLAKS